MFDSVILELVQNLFGDLGFVVNRDHIDFDKEKGANFDKKSFDKEVNLGQFAGYFVDIEVVKWDCSEKHKRK